MSTGLARAAVEHGVELPVPAWAFGATTLLIFFVLLALVLMMGKGRPHA